MSDAEGAARVDVDLPRGRRECGSESHVTGVIDGDKAVGRRRYRRAGVVEIGARADEVAAVAHRDRAVEIDIPRARGQRQIVSSAGNRAVGGDVAALCTGAEDDVAAEGRVVVPDDVAAVAGGRDIP